MRQLRPNKVCTEWAVYAAVERAIAYLALVLALRIIRAFLVEEAKIVKAVLASQKQKK